MKIKNAVPHEDPTIELLRDSEFASDYLNAVIDGLSVTDAMEPTLIALGRIAKAQGMGKVSSDSKRTRDTVYKALSKHKNPTYKTLAGILDSMDLQMRFEPRKKSVG